MAERVDTFLIQAKPFSVEIVGVFDLGSDGLIKGWQEYFDSQPITEQVQAAGITLPT
jgi:limonene-1,2-epoxide hydrolase